MHPTRSQMGSPLSKHTQSCHKKLESSFFKNRASCVQAFWGAMVLVFVILCLISLACCQNAEPSISAATVRTAVFFAALENCFHCELTRFEGAAANDNNQSFLPVCRLFFFLFFSFF